METLRIRRGDDTSFLNECPTITIDTEDDLTGYRGVLQIQGLQIEFPSEEVEQKLLTVSLTHEQTLTLTPGIGRCWLKLIDPDNRRMTFDIPLEIQVLKDRVPCQ